MSFTLPELPYPKDALEPVISEKTIDYHYGKHHQAYVTNLNNLIPGTEFENLSLEEIIQKCLPTYQVVGKLGEGLYGSVYRIRDRFKERAVKVVPVKT